MNTEYFSHFIRVTYPSIELSNDDCKEIGDEFKEYLIDKFKDKLENLERFWNIDMMTVIMNQDNPIMQKGYHPALVLHFNEFINIMQNK